MCVSLPLLFYALISLLKSLNIFSKHVLSINPYLPNSFLPMLLMHSV